MRLASIERLTLSEVVFIVDESTLPHGFHSPTSCLVATLRRFQTLIVAIERTRAASAGSSQCRAASCQISSGTGSARSLRRVTSVSAQRGPLGVWAPGGKIVEIDLLADPLRLAELDLVILND